MAEEQAKTNSLQDKPSCFYKNKECKYYPCHSGLERINCLFCFCPLYTFDDCGGTYEMLNGIKDCSECLFPHKAENYGVILRKLVDVNKQKMEQFGSLVTTQTSNQSNLSNSDPSKQMSHLERALWNIK